MAADKLLTNSRVGPGSRANTSGWDEGTAALIRIRGDAGNILGASGLAPVPAQLLKATNFVPAQSLSCGVAALTPAPVPG